MHSSYLGRIFAEALKSRACQRAWVVCGREGLDEISIEGETDVWELMEGEIRQLVISPKDFGLVSHPLTKVASHTSAENAAIVFQLLGDVSGSQSDSDEAELESKVVSSLPPVPAGTDLKAIRDYTLLQTAALLYVGGYAGDSYLEATRLARISMDSGAARKALRSFRLLAHRAVEKQEQEQAEQNARDAEALARRRAALRESKDARDSLLDEKKDEYFYAPEPVRSVGVGTDD